jgi:Undecaprenyl-phosphate glucose phosphotransferase
MLIDALLLIASGAFLGGLIGEAHSASAFLADWQWWAIALSVCTHFVIARLLEVYCSRTIFDPKRAITRLPISLLMSFMALLVITVATKTSESYSRLWFFSWLLLSFALIMLSRFLVLERVGRLIKNGAFVYKALSIGVFCDPFRPEQIVRQTNNEVRVEESLRLQSFDELALLSERIVRDEIDWVYIATPWVDIPAVLRNLHLLQHLSTRIFVLPGDRTAGLNIEGVSFLGDRPVFCAIEEPINGWDLWLKRGEDIVITGAALLFCSPLMALIALAIRLDSPGPIVFRQARVGFNGKIFECWKFRSMFVEATDLHATVQTSRGDARVTRVGRFIRSRSLDELPQFFNVLQGTMSVVGPRPHALSTRTEGRNLDEVVDYYAARHKVRPGLTGWAQIHGFRGELDSTEKLQKRVDLDIDYIDRWSIWLDLKIIFMTALITFRDPHAY